MSYFYSMCLSSTLNPQEIIYNGHSINFYYKSLNIIWSHHIQDFILKASDSINNHPNSNGPTFIATTKNSKGCKVDEI